VSGSPHLEITHGRGPDRVGWRRIETFIVCTSREELDAFITQYME
jgi:hypothetical protein